MAWRLSRVSSPSSSTLESPKAGGAASGRCFPGFGFVKAHARGKAPPTPSCKLYVSTTKLKLRDQTSIRLVKQPSTKMALTCDTIEEEAGTLLPKTGAPHATRRGVASAALVALCFTGGVAYSSTSAAASTRVSSLVDTSAANCASKVPSPICGESSSQRFFETKAGNEVQVSYSHSINCDGDPQLITVDIPCVWRFR